MKGANAIKVYGPELDIIARKAEEIRKVMAKVDGVADLAVFRSLGQPTVAVQIDRARAARFGLSIGDINEVVQAAIGGSEAGRLYEPGGDRNFPLVVRLDAPYPRQPGGDRAASRSAARGRRRWPMWRISAWFPASPTSTARMPAATCRSVLASVAATPPARWPRHRRWWRSRSSCRRATGWIGSASSATCRRRWAG